ncbi:hypothetical protein NLY34_19020 [Mesorhizobium sp. C374B]|uniref:hypothetical protein n=1 Tax=unclassified Mesorhizobium TaxID=325217 RepID=UPI0018DE111A|nr:MULTISPECIES: hypothetical protein [unclassified Mesorhizobium]WJI84403.1 hypothetical protein NLY34_19020 [Mesorhizobium sp. C374B]
MSDEPSRLAEGMTGAPRDRRRVDNHACEHAGCGRDGGFGFAKPRMASHWFCMEHRSEGERYLAGAGRHQ